jgi:hypothetical protein
MSLAGLSPTIQKLSSSLPSPFKDKDEKEGEDEEEFPPPPLLPLLSLLLSLA